MRFGIILVILTMILVACVPVEQETQTPPVENITKIPPKEIETPPVEIPKEETKEAMASRYTMNGVEGDLIQLKPKAIDPDGDKITFTFTEPFDKDGRWQTKIGDEGAYVVTIGASDGKSSTTQKINVVVSRANRAPIVNCRPVTINEGETIDLSDACSITDEDNKDLSIAYSGWMTNTKYTTTFGDAGSHLVTVTVSDRENKTVLHTVIQNTTITVKKMNRAPVFADKFPTKITAIENDVIVLPKESVSDPDKDKITYTFSPPFGADGVWKTKIGDAGNYDVDVVASDGTASTKKTVSVNVKVLVTPPVLKNIPDVVVNEGETIKLAIDAYDRTGAKLKVTISGWMNSDTYTTKFGDAGKYTTRVTVSNGQYETSQVVMITVVKVNRAPVFITPA